MQNYFAGNQMANYGARPMSYSPQPYSVPRVASSYAAPSYAAPTYTTQAPTFATTASATTTAASYSQVMRPTVTQAPAVSAPIQGLSTLTSRPTQYTTTGAQGLPTNYPGSFTSGARPQYSYGTQPITQIASQPAMMQMAAQPAMTQIAQPAMMQMAAQPAMTQYASQPAMTQYAAQPQMTQIMSQTRPAAVLSAPYAATSYRGGTTVAMGSTNYLQAGQPQQVVYESMPQQVVYESMPQQQVVYETMPQQMVYETMPQQVVYETMPQQQVVYETMQAEMAPQVVMVQAAGGGFVEVYNEAPVEVFTEMVQPVTEMFVGPDGQVEMVQAEVITDMVQTADGQVQMVQTLVEGQQVEVVEGQQEQPGPPRVVIVCTSADDLNGQPTGAWSEEITGPYYVFSEAGCEVYFASPMGGKVPLDALSLSENFFTENDRRFQEDGLMSFLDNSYALGEISPEAIDCVWLAGGHGTCMDFEANLAQFVTDALGMGRPVGAVCHGVIGLLSAVDQDGTPLLTGKQVTGFSNAEEEQVGLIDTVPFLIEQRMQELQADYSCGEPWGEYALRDGKIITGQNPQSSVRTAQLCIEAMMQPY